MMTQNNLIKEFLEWEPHSTAQCAVEPRPSSEEICEKEATKNDEQLKTHST